MLANRHHVGGTNEPVEQASFEDGFDCGVVWVVVEVSGLEGVGHEVVQLGGAEWAVYETVGGGPD